MEVVGKLHFEQPQVSPDFEGCFHKLAFVTADTYVGLSKNGLLIEVKNEKFTKAAAKIEAAKEVTEVKIVHGLEDYVAIVVKAKGFEVYDSSLKLIEKCEEKFVKLEVEDDPKKGYEVLKIYVSVCDVKIKDFFATNRIDLDSPPNAKVLSVLEKQRQDSLKASDFPSSRTAISLKAALTAKTSSNITNILKKKRRNSENIRLKKL